MSTPTMVTLATPTYFTSYTGKSGTVYTPNPSTATGLSNGTITVAVGNNDLAELIGFGCVVSNPFYNGHFYFSANTIFAAGNSQSSATLVTQDTMLVIPTGPNQGVQLPPAIGGAQTLLVNGSYTSSFYVYPNNGGNDSINAQAPNTPYVVPPLYEVLAAAYTTSFWSVGLSDVTPSTAYNTDSSVSSHTLTASSITSTQVGFTDVTLALSGNITASSVLTLPTVSSVVAAIVNPVAGQSYNLRIRNGSVSSFTWTVSSGTGWSTNGTMTIAQATGRDFYVTVGVAATGSLSSAILQDRGSVNA